LLILFQSVLDGINMKLNVSTGERKRFLESKEILVKEGKRERERE